MEIVEIYEEVNFDLTAMSNNHKSKLEELNLTGLAEILGLEILLASNHLLRLRVL